MAQCTVVESNYFYKSTQKSGAKFLCANCGITFSPKMYEVVYKQDDKCFCTYNCRAEWRRKINESFTKKPK